MTFEVKTNAAQVARVVGAIPDELAKAMTQAGDRVGKRYLGFHRARRMRGGKGVRATRKGLLSQFSYNVTGTNIENMTLRMGTKSPVAVQHEHGHVFPKPRIIPFSSLSPAKRKLIRSQSKARTLILIKTQSGRAFLAKPKWGGALGKRRVTRVEIVATVRRHVRLRPRLGFHEEWAAYKPQALTTYNQALKFALAAARRKRGQA